ncbi:glucose 1-dehydrogenase [Rhodococcus sp. MS16]|uniref:SDR family NAD(P)-dependent oxidoreductase n=1 Tax=Rhodococcus TaxID=1827 RepID=UPI001562A33A|nr:MULTISPECIES: glucose 1-dehydrogenase [Rhodococcus]MCE4267523.1 glucose 1-dehydrogenase [Rhodococcus globerulus]NRI68741.1 glucose 1-dehydrogenase [Rhodococcus sp. MS16]
MELNLRGKTALVTGASKGIGRSIAVTFAKAGADVAIAARSIDLLREVEAEIASHGVRAHVIQADTSTPEGNERLFADADKALGPIGILVNNAGGGGTYIEGGSETLLNTSAKAAREIFELNVIGPTVLAKVAAESMREQGGGVIINMSSRLAASPNPSLGIYCASKSAIQTLTTAWAMELGEHGIRVNAIAPGGVATSNMDRILDDETLRTNFLATVPLKRFGLPDDAAHCALFLASDAATWVSGATLLLSGGRP